MPEDESKLLISKNDSLLFAESMTGVKPLALDKHNLASHKPKPKPYKRPVIQSKLTRPSHDQHVNNIQANDRLLFARQGVQHKLVRQLKQGRLDNSGTLDLHGLNQQAAHQALDEFLAFHLDQGSRCIIVIHGKGFGSINNQPVLKNLVFNQLKATPYVLAFSSAQPCHGGTGSVYVLLKNGSKGK